MGDIDWIVLSYRTVGKWLLIGLLSAGAVVLGYFLYQQNHESPQIRARRQIEQAESALQNAQSSPEASHFTVTLSQAKDRLSEARDALGQAKYERAYELAIESESLSRRATGRSSRADIGDATFVALDGEVTLQRAGRGTWEECKLRQAIYNGDFIKTTRTGSAEIMFFDGTLYQLRPDTLFEVKIVKAGEADRSSGSDVSQGAVSVFTSNSVSQVKTSAVTVEAERESQVSVSIDPKSHNTDVANYRGTALLRTEKQSIVLSEREKVSAQATSQAISQKTMLPESPALIDPADNRVFDPKTTADILLRWTSVKEAVRYRLQVSRSRLFIPDATPLDLPNRTGVSASIRPHEEGSYYWRVASITAAGVSSDWSAYRRFRITTDKAKEIAGTPPSLRVEAPLQMGNLFLVSGQTDPSASVSVNGKRADVEPSGSFKLMVTVDTEGESQIVVKAADAAGRETIKRIRVAVDLN